MKSFYISFLTEDFHFLESITGKQSKVEMMIYVEIYTVQGNVYA